MPKVYDLIGLGGVQNLLWLLGDSHSADGKNPHFLKTTIFWHSWLLVSLSP